MANELLDKANNVKHLLQQTLDEEIGPIRDGVAETKTATAEARTIIDRLVSEVQALREKNKQIELALNRPGVGGYDSPEVLRDRRRAEGKSAYNKACYYGGVSHLTPEERKYIRLDSEVQNLDPSGMKVQHGGNGEEYKTMYGSLAESGGFLMTPEVATELIESIILVSDMRSLVNVRQTAKPWVSIRKRTQTTSAVRIAEQAARTETQNLKFGMVQIFPYESYALSVITRQDLDDSELDLAAYLNKDFAIQFAKLVGAEILNGLGAGAGQCHGLLQDAAIIAAAQTSTNSTLSSLTSFSYADLATLVTSIKTGYRKGASWIAETQTLGLLMGMTTTIGTPLIPAWTSGPPTMFGYPIYEMPDMPAVAAGNLAIGFGNWNTTYTFVERTQVSVQVLVEYYANLAAVGYMAYYRFGGTVALSEACNFLKIHA